MCASVVADHVSFPRLRGEACRCGVCLGVNGRRPDGDGAVRCAEKSTGWWCWARRSGAWRLPEVCPSSPTWTSLSWSRRLSLSASLCVGVSVFCLCACAYVIGRGVPPGGGPTSSAASSAAPHVVPRRPRQPHRRHLPLLCAACGGVCDRYTPGVLHCFVRPNHFPALCAPTAECVPPNARWVNGSATAVDAAAGRVTVNQPASGTSTDVPFDSLVVATGTSYGGLMKAAVADPSVAARRAALRQESFRIASAGSALVVGGGAVGVELAAELCYFHPALANNLTLVSTAPRLLADMAPAVSAAALAWLTRRHVRVVLNCKATPVPGSPGRFTLSSDGSVIGADVHFMCIGGSATVSFLDGAVPADALHRRGVAVDDTLCANWEDVAAGRSKPVYAIGDVAVHASQPAGLASVAEFQAKVLVGVVAHRARTTSTGAPPTYPAYLTGRPSAPVVVCVSLGPHEALVVCNTVCLTGWLGRRVGAVLKTVIERTKVWQLRRFKLAQWFWDFGDGATFFLTRTVLPPPGVAAPSSAPANQRASHSPTPVVQ